MSWDILPKGNLQYFLQKLKGKLDSKVDAVSGKGLSTNDFTTTEKNKLAGIEAGAQVNPTIDSALSDSSVNAVQNKIVKTALDGKADSDDILGSKSVNGNPIVISDAANAYAEEVIANIEPIQDLHGYDHPWVGGAGKNLLPLTENAITDHGITITPNKDNAGNVVSLTLNGTATDDAYIFIAKDISIPNERFTLSWQTINNYLYMGLDGLIDAGGGATIGYRIYDGDGVKRGVFVRVYGNRSYNNIVIYPMLELGSSATSFIPYSNICPITGYTEIEVEDCGKNFIGKGTQRNGFVNASIMKFYVNASSVGYYFNTADLPDEITFNAVNGNRAYYGYFNTVPQEDADCLVVNQSQKTLPNSITVNKSYKYIHLQFSYYQAVSNVQVEQGSTATEYEPYLGETHTTTLPQTTYGGTLNVQTGELVVDRASVDLGDLNWIYHSESGNFYVDNAVGDRKAKNNAICSCYEKNSNVYSVAELTSNGKFAFQENLLGRIIIRDTRYTDTTTFKEAVTGQTLVYELATPQTYHLTPEQVKLLKGYNYITTNADTLDIVYQVNNVLGEILSESEEYADRAIDSLGDQCIKNDGVEGNSTIITSYSSVSNHFTTPTDGYIKFSVPLNYTDRYVTVYFLYPDLEHIWLIKKMAGNNSYSFEDAIFVKKGTICMVYENSVDATVYFVS